MADPDFAQRLDTEIAALKEEQVRKQERAKAEEAKKAQQEKEKVEADLRQLKQDTAAFLQQHSGKSIRNMTTLEVQELVGLWTDLQSRWDKFEANNKDEFKQSRLNVLSLETFYSVFGKPGRVQTGLAATAWGGFFDCNVFVYECRDSIVGIKVTVEKKDGSTLTRIVGFEAS
jgi:outer membrane phospholipase A